MLATNATSMASRLYRELRPDPNFDYPPAIDFSAAASRSDGPALTDTLNLVEAASPFLGTDYSW